MWRNIYRVLIILLAAAVICGGVYLISKSSGAASLSPLNGDGQTRLRSGADGFAPGNRTSDAGQTQALPDGTSGPLAQGGGRGMGGGRGLGRGESASFGLGMVSVLKNLGIIILVSIAIAAVDSINKKARKNLTQSPTA